MYGLQGLRFGVPHHERARRRRSLANGRVASRWVDSGADATNNDHVLPPLCRTRVHVRLSRQCVREVSDYRYFVKHLDDQRFGRQYCTLMCLYDALKYNVARGIVRKCDM